MNMGDTQKTQAKFEAVPSIPKKFRHKKRKYNSSSAVKDQKKVVCKVPSNNNEISANWKQMQTKLASQKNKKNFKDLSNLGNSSNKKTKMNLKHSKVTSLEVKKPDDIWFEDVDPCLIRSSQLASNQSDSKSLCKSNSFAGLTRYVAMDCEMVGTGFDGTVSILARVSIVNLYGHCIYDKFVKPTEEVTDYRTHVSGIRPENLTNGEDFKVVQQEVFKILESRILVGHSVHYDLKVLFLSHPKHMIRDTCSYFRKFFNNRMPSLKKLSEVYLGIKIQGGEHDSVTDAQATMRLFTLFKKQWEPTVNKRFKNKPLTQTTLVV